MKLSHHLITILAVVGAISCTPLKQDSKLDGSKKLGLDNCIPSPDKPAELNPDKPSEIAGGPDQPSEIVDPLDLNPDEPSEVAAGPADPSEIDSGSLFEKLQDVKYCDDPAEA